MLQRGSNRTYTGKAQSIVLASGRSISKVALFNALHYGGWLALGMAWSIGAVSSRGPWPTLLDYSTWILCGCVLTLFFHRVYRRIRAAKVSYARLGVVALTFSILGAPAWYVAEHAADLIELRILMHIESISHIFAADAHATAIESWRIPIDAFVMHSIILFTWSSLYFGINAMIDLEMERARASGAIKLAESARLRALQSQLNPHFIFNALNGITTLIRDKDGTAAAAMVDALSDFLRSMLKTIEVPEVSVAEELHFINQYLSIQGFRFGSRLQIRVEADPEALRALIPTFILQPLVENAVKHGVLPREEGGSLYVQISKCEEILLVSVEDDGPGLANKAALKYGVGLGNSVDRLSALYGDAARLSVGPRNGEGGGFSVVLRLPFREASEMSDASSASRSAVLAT